MDVLLINPPYLTITSNVGVGHQVPLGLLMVGGPLIDAGHRVRLLDAECERMSIDAVVRRVVRLRPDVVMTGHAGSTPAHPVCLEMLRAIKAALPDVVTVYGGIYPTYHAAEILRAEPSVDVVVRGEGEATGVELIAALDGRVRTTLEPRADTAPSRPPARPTAHLARGTEPGRGGRSPRLRPRVRVRSQRRELRSPRAGTARLRRSREWAAFDGLGRTAGRPHEGRGFWDA